MVCVTRRRELRASLYSAEDRRRPVKALGVKCRECARTGARALGESRETVARHEAKEGLLGAAKSFHGWRDAAKV